MSGQWSESKHLEKTSKQPGFDRIQHPKINDVNLISAGYQDLFYTGYHELSPLEQTC